MWINNQTINITTNNNQWWNVAKPYWLLKMHVNSMDWVQTIEHSPAEKPTNTTFDCKHKARISKELAENWLVVFCLFLWFNGFNPPTKLQELKMSSVEQDGSLIKNMERITVEWNDWMNYNRPGSVDLTVFLLLSSTPWRGSSSRGL